MNKNLVLVQNGYPHSKTSGTEVDSLNINNFFKYEKDVVPTKYSYLSQYNAYSNSMSLAPFYNINVWKKDEATIQKVCNPSAWYEKDGTLKFDTLFEHYSISFLLFAVRMEKGFLGTDVTIASRLAEDSPLKLRFFDIGDTLDDFKKLNKLSYWFNDGSFEFAAIPHKSLSNALSINTLTQYNHCFLAALFSDSVYLKQSGTKLLDNEPLLNISWTETAFTTEG